MIISGSIESTIPVFCLTLVYEFNPEKKGFATNSDWSVDTYETDRKKVDYINTLKSWGRKWNKQVDAGFKGQLPK